MDYLRAKKISTPKNPATLSKMSSNETNSFKHLVQHLGLTEEIFPVIKESFVSHCSEIDMDGSNGYAIFLRHNNASRSVTAFAFGTYIYDSEVFRLKLVLYNNMQDHYGSSNLLDVGIINEDVETSQFIPSYISFERSTLSLFFGYSVGSQGITINGKGNNDNYNGYYWKHGDIIELLLDCDATMLFLNTPTGKQFQLNYPSGQNLDHLSV
ncbi:Hypothetical predicted protein [Paramuricea clavata]|uniref:Uncharacterized protein n=1 Tax=Paramuricea clavata TaxID=317549 RepID=A0A7D9J957_PARCT|nr:Hypothetical predicted protein [Paramuricea clavata]